MASPELLARWAETEVVLRRVVSSNSEALDVADQTWIHGLLDHNELGLAAERLMELLPNPSPELDAACRLMGIDAKR